MSCVLLSLIIIIYIVKKDAIETDIKIKVCVFAFDLIFINNKSLITESLRTRRDLLTKYFPHAEDKFLYATSMNSKDLESVQEFLEKSVKGKLLSY